jgi:tetratricopeptide (TPR) repeat protein
MAGLKRMWSQIVGFAFLIALLYGVSIPANALTAMGVPGVLAWGAGIVLVIAVIAGLVIGWRRFGLWRDKPLAQWQKLDSQALALQKRAEANPGSDADLSAAESLYKQALDVAEASQRPAMIATALNNLAGLYVGEDRSTDAIPMYERALDLRRSALGRDAEMTLKSLERLSASYAAVNRWEDVERTQRQALDSYRRVAPKSSAVSETLDAIGVACRHQGKFGEADSCYSEALQLLKANSEEKSQAASQILHDWGFMRKEQGRNEEAESLLRQSLNLRENNLEYLDTANTLDQLADLYVSEGRYAEAAEASTRQVSLVERAVRLQAPTKKVALVPLYEQHAARLERAGRDPDAAEYKSKADAIRAAASPGEIADLDHLMQQASSES